MKIDEKEQEYWNGVERAQVDYSKDYYSDNFQKRRVLIGALSNYDLVGTKILEIGTGLGLTASIMRVLNRPIVYMGVDISQTYAKAAKKFFNLDVKIADATELPRSDASTDVIFAFDSLEHISAEKKPLVWKEIDRVLKKQRIIFINNPIEESRHVEEFEHGFSQKEVGELCEATKTTIIEVKILNTRYGKYQFIVLASL